MRFIGHIAHLFQSVNTFAKKKKRLYPEIDSDSKKPRPLIKELNGPKNALWQVWLH